MRKTIIVNNYKLCYSYDCDTNESFYDIYDENENWLGEIPSSYVEDNLIDEDAEEYDIDGLEVLIEDFIEE